MFQIIKSIFWGLVIFIGLYLFGDFNLNGVNVRDYLRQRVTWQSVVAIKDLSVDFVSAVQGVLEKTAQESQANSGPNKNQVPLQGLTDSLSHDNEKILDVVQSVIKSGEQVVDDVQKNKQAPGKK